MIENTKIRKILIIGDNVSSYIIRSITKSLANAGYEVEAIEPKINHIDSLTYTPDLILIYAGEPMDKDSETLIYLKDYCIEHEKKVALIGYENDVEFVRKTLTEKLVWKHFHRPFNMEDFIEATDQELERVAENERKKHILVVDDSGTTLRMVNGWLSEHYRISMANSAASAISLLSSQKIDLILLDYSMPICSGPQFLQMIRAEMKTSSTPVIFLTGKSDRHSVKTAVGLKPDGYLLKTLPKEEIVNFIDDFFEKRKSLNF